MPRIFSSCNDPYDYCKKHFPSEEEAEEEFGNVGDGPDGRGNCFAYDAEHPDYSDWDDYVCHDCKKKLTAKDN